MNQLNKSDSLNKLTSDQKIAAKLFSKWLEDGQRDFPFVISGYAGSGKTYLSSHILKIVEEKGLCWTVAAPTHKAVGVLRNYLNEKDLRPTWHSSTIHRLLRLKLKRKGDLETCEETEQTSKSLENLDLVLIDEASMIDSKLLLIILKCAHIFKTRIVFVGDSAQLPPIGEPKSPVFSLKNSLNVCLKEVVRHKGPVLTLANKLRDGQIPCSPPTCFPIVNTKEGIVGCLDQSSWLKRAKESLKISSIEGNPDSARILCFTNRTLEMLVPHARRAIHGEMADQLPVLPGEILISRSAVMAPASMEGSEKGEDPDMVIGSNRELLVLDVKPENCDLAEFGLNDKDDWNVPTIDTLTAKIRSNELEISLRLLPPVGSDSRRLLDDTLLRLRIEAKNAGKTGGRSIWRNFFLVRDAFASLGPASVLTVHRSQGSSFGEVFIASDVFWPNDLLLRRQLVYVAVSRASKAVWLVANNKSGLTTLSWDKHLTL